MEISEIPQQYHEKLILNLIWFYRMIHGFWLKESKLVDYNLGISSLAKRCYLFCYILSNQKEALFFFLFFLWVANMLWILMVDIPCRQSKTWKLHFFLRPNAGGKAGPGTAGGACSAALVSRGWRDNKASSQLHSPDLCFGLALSFFVVVAASMELLGTGCAFLWVRLKHMP